MKNKSEEIEIEGKKYIFETNENQIIKTLRKPEFFLGSSFIMEDIGAGITLVLGRLVTDPTGSMFPQSIIFDKEQWGLLEAQQWFDSNRHSFSTDEEGENLKKYDRLEAIKGVEIFSVGTWNGDEYTMDDLNEMVKAFTENSNIKPFLKLGHNSKQKIIAEDGLPAAGWIDNIYIEGGKLLADFVDIPKKIFQLIKNRAYKKVSSEIFWNIKLNGKVYKRMLSAVALLGSDMPAVTNLKDILSLYGLKGYEQLKTYAKDEEQEIKIYDYLTGGHEMKEKMEKLETENTELKTSQTALAAENKELKEFKEAQDKKIADQDAKLAKEKIENFTLSLEKEEIMTPSMKPYVQALLGEDKKEYTFGEDEKLTKEETIKKLLSLKTETDLVNFDENSEEGDVKENKADDAKIEKYMDEHKVSYSMAYKAIMKKD